jgi:hypothetical protein
MVQDMKTCRTSIISKNFFIIMALIFMNNLLANNSKNPDNEKAEAGNYVFRLQNSTERYMTVDSALIILDKFDLTGAGVVMKVVPVDSNHQLNLTDIPVGKYYAGIYTYGLRKEYISIVITVTGNVKKKKSRSVKINVADAEAYIPGKVIIPPEDISLFSYALL